MKVFNPEKELYKIQHRNRNKTVLFVTLLLIVSVISYSFALYQVRYSKRIIYTKVAPFSNHDLELAVYVGDKQLTDFLENAGYQYIFDYIKCEKDGITTAKWDLEQGGLSILTKGPNRCNIYFVEKLEIEFPYVGEQITEYEVPYTGNYKLEVWGAQGGGAATNYTGGYGGYAKGIIKLNDKDKLFIVVGGQGITGTSLSGNLAGGYNGGGSTNYSWPDTYVGSGGGATHIATESGLLSELENKKDSILIVSGGGGGSAYDIAGYPFNKGGNAGGYIGVNGTGKETMYGGSQTSGGGDGLFGRASSTNAAGGGGGWYGGSRGGACGSSAGGGSSYISPKLTDAAMYCHSCTTSNNASTLTYSVTNVSADPVANSAKTGAGYAKITYLGQQN